MAEVTQSPVCTPNDRTWYNFKDGLTATGGELIFRVQANKNAHVALGSSQITYSGGRNIPDHYEILLGGWYNTRSIIRSSTEGIMMASHTGAVLSSSEFRKFRIRWNADLLAVDSFDSSGWVLMMSAPPNELTNDYSITRAMVMTGSGGSGCWEYMVRSLEDGRQ